MTGSLSKLTVRQNGPYPRWWVARSNSWIHTLPGAHLRSRPGLRTRARQEFPQSPAAAHVTGPSGAGLLRRPAVGPPKPPVLEGMSRHRPDAGRPSANEWTVSSTKPVSASELHSGVSGSAAVAGSDPRSSRLSILPNAGGAKTDGSFPPFGRIFEKKGEKRAISGCSSGETAPVTPPFAVTEPSPGPGSTAPPGH